MKFWSITFTLIAGMFIAGAINQNKLGDQITRSIIVLSHVSWTATDNVVYASTADALRDATTSSKAVAYHLEVQENQGLTKRVLTQLDEVIEIVPLDCNETKRVLTIRHNSAIKNKEVLTFNDLSQWINYARKDCLQMPKAEKLILK